jgi:Notch-like protein
LSKLSHNSFANIKFNNTSTKGIERIVKSLKNSHGYDEISTKILQVSAPFITSLNYIFNKSIISGTFPTHLKYSIVKPLFKKGDNKNMTNYRLISLVTSFSKVF